LDALEQLDAILEHVEERVLAKNLTFQFASALNGRTSLPNLSLAILLTSPVGFAAHAVAGGSRRFRPRQAAR